MIDHVGIYVVDFMRSKLFYEKVLATINYTIIADLKEIQRAGFGYKTGQPFFWITGMNMPIMSFHPDILAQSPVTSMIKCHLAFRASSLEAVNAFYEHAMEAGAKSGGIPGPRVEYHEKYYAAYMYDHDGNNIEVVFHDHEQVHDEFEESTASQQISFLF